jgi:hypothetical protein
LKQKHKPVKVYPFDKKEMLPPRIEHDASSYYSKVFVIKYTNDEIALNEII